MSDKLSHPEKHLEPAKTSEPFAVMTKQTESFVPAKYHGNVSQGSRDDERIESLFSS